MYIIKCWKDRISRVGQIWCSSIRWYIWLLAHRPSNSTFDSNIVSQKKNISRSNRLVTIKKEEEQISNATDLNKEEKSRTVHKES